MNKISIIIPYYNQPQMFAIQLAYMGNYSGFVRGSIEVIFIDDGSQTFPMQVPPSMGFQARFFRTLQDVPWNSPFCRNLGARHARHEWLLLNDIDHLLPNELLSAIISRDLDSATIYLPSRERIHEPGIEYKPPTNVFFIHKSIREQLIGEDERLSGHYSGQDCDFINRSKAVAKWVQISERSIVVGSDIVPDAKTKNLPRKSPEDYAAVAKILEDRNAQAGWVPVTLSFPWVELSQTPASKEV